MEKPSITAGQGVSDPHEAGLSADRCEAVLGPIFRDFFDDDTLVLRPDMTAPEIDGWDSLAHIRLLLTIERKLHVSFSASEVGALHTVGDLALLVTSKKNATAR